MDFEYDPRKDATNQAKHGIPLRYAADLFDGPVYVKADARKDYGERRFIAYGWIARRLFVCVFTDRGRTRRIISLRRANKREQNAYRQSRPEES